MAVGAARPRAAREFFAAKNVIVTGGSRGLGFALTERLLAAGANVTICGRSQATLERAAERLSTFGDSLAVRVCDVRSQAACDELVRDVIERRGSVDILINNAGVIEVGPLAAQTVDDFREAMDTHFWGVLFMTLAVLPAMRARRSGQIVNIASVGGVVGVPHLAPYAASKFAQIGLTQAIAAEAKADGVTLTSIIPGLMQTGSPDHAIFKGRNRAEYAWFTLSDANPLLSTSARSAVERILRAIRRREAVATIGWSAAAAKSINALFPRTTARLVAFAASLLPDLEGANAADARAGRVDGAASHSAWTENPLTALNARAAERTNQLPLPAASGPGSS